MIDLASIPRVGEKFETGDQGTLEVIEVVHTPLIREWDAVVVLKANQPQAKAGPGAGT